MPEVPLMATGGRFQKRVDPWCHLLLKQRHQWESTVTSWHQHHWTILAAVDELAKYNIRKNDPKKHYNYIYSLFKCAVKTFGSAWAPEKGRSSTKLWLLWSLSKYEHFWFQKTPITNRYNITLNHEMMQSPICPQSSWDILTLVTMC